MSSVRFTAVPTFEPVPTFTFSAGWTQDSGGRWKGPIPDTETRRRELFKEAFRADAAGHRICPFWIGECISETGPEEPGSTDSADDSEEDEATTVKTKAIIKPASLDEGKAKDEGKAQDEKNKQESGQPRVSRGRVLLCASSHVSHSDEKTQDTSLPPACAFSQRACQARPPR